MKRLIGCLLACALWLALLGAVPALAADRTPGVVEELHPPEAQELISKEHMKIVGCTSHTNWSVDALLNGVTDEEDGWHTAAPATESAPVYLTVDLGASEAVSYFAAFPRKEWRDWGDIPGKFDLYVGETTPVYEGDTLLTSDNNLGTLAVEAAFQYSAAYQWQGVSFDAVQGRYVTLKVYSPTISQNNAGDMRFVEVDFGTAPSTEKIPFGQMAATSSPVHENNTADRAIDGDPNTYWHSQVGDYERTITVDLNKNADAAFAGYRVSRVDYVQRQQDWADITAYKLYGSLDGEQYFAISTGELQARTPRQSILFPPVTVRYLRLQATRGTRGEYVSIAELEIYRESDPAQTGDLLLPVADWEGEPFGTVGTAGDVRQEPLDGLAALSGGRSCKLSAGSGGGRLLLTDHYGAASFFFKVRTGAEAQRLEVGANPDGDDALTPLGEVTLYPEGGVPQQLTGANGVYTLPAAFTGYLVVANQAEVAVETLAIGLPADSAVQEQVLHLDNLYLFTGEAQKAIEQAEARYENAQLSCAVDFESEADYQLVDAQVSGTAALEQVTQALCGETSLRLTATKDAGAIRIDRELGQQNLALRVKTGGHKQYLLVGANADSLYGGSYADISTGTISAVDLSGKEQNLFPVLTGLGRRWCYHIPANFDGYLFLENNQNTKISKLLIGFPAGVEQAGGHEILLDQLYTYPQGTDAMAMFAMILLKEQGMPQGQQCLNDYAGLAGGVLAVVPEEQTSLSVTSGYTRSIAMKLLTGGNGTTPVAVCVTANDRETPVHFRTRDAEAIWGATGERVNVTYDPLQDAFLLPPGFSGYLLLENSHGVDLRQLYLTSSQALWVDAVYAYGGDFSLFPVEVTGGTVQESMGRPWTYFAPGETVCAAAEVPAGKVFQRWSADGTVLPGDLEEAQQLTFTMPEQAVALRAVYTTEAEEKPAAPNPVPALPVTPTPSTGSYYDVGVGSWSYDAVSYVTEAGLMTGVGNGKFNPDGDVTRAMVWTVLARMAGENTEGGSTWYAKAQAWAMRTRVSDGTNPMGSITREQLAAMLYRFEGSPKVTGNLSAYPDANTVSDWAKDALVWATQEGIINGIGGHLSPETGATRAQLAAMLMRMLER